MSLSGSILPQRRRRVRHPFTRIWWCPNRVLSRFARFKLHINHVYSIQFICPRYFQPCSDRARLWILQNGGLVWCCLESSSSAVLAWCKNSCIHSRQSTRWLRTKTSLIMILISSGGLSASQCLYHRIQLRSAAICSTLISSTLHTCAYPMYGKSVYSRTQYISMASTSRSEAAFGLCFTERRRLKVQDWLWTDTFCIN